MTGWDNITTKKVDKQVQVGNVVFPDMETKEKLIGGEPQIDSKKEADKTTISSAPLSETSVVPSLASSASLLTSKKPEVPAPIITKREFVYEPTRLVSEKSPIVLPAATVDGIKKWQKNFNEVKAALIDNKKDVIMIKDIPYIKKSGWRKLATAFNLVDEVIFEEKIADKPNVYTWKIGVRMIAPNGRSAIGIAMCSTKEFNFIRREHDIYSTAHTRAKNRATSDLIGGGEVSYEELPEEERSKGGEMNGKS